MIIYGTDLFGKVDQVPGKFFVATQFEHLYLFPVIPKQSFIVVESSVEGDSFQGVKIPMSFKSVLLAYFRGILGAIGIIMGLFGATLLFLGLTTPGDWKSRVGGIEMLGIMSVCIFGLWGTSRLFHASPKKKMELTRQLGLHSSTINTDRFEQPKHHVN